VAERAGPRVRAHLRAREARRCEPALARALQLLGRLGPRVMRKIQAEPDVGGNPRWRGTGRTVFDTRERAQEVRAVLLAHACVRGRAVHRHAGVTPILRYDPLGRLTRTDFPNGTFETVVFDAWSETHADRNDNVLESAWYAAREALPTSDPERHAADAAAKHAHTPAVRKVDPLGRRSWSSRTTARLARTRRARRSTSRATPAP